MSGSRGFRALNALRVISFSGASPAALATAVEAWVGANASQRSFVQIDYLESGGTWVAFLTYTE